MPQVDFYVLSEKHSIDVFLCQLSHKIWQQGHEMYIHTNHQEQATQLNDRMWTYSDISFLPHQIQSDEETADAPICIGWQTQYSGNQDVMINLNSSVPQFSQGFARIVEIVSTDEASKKTGREHFREYRELGCTLESHIL